MTKKKAVSSEEVEKVELKPLAGMEPGLYLTIFYSIILFLILFAVLVLPGIVNGGAIVEFRSSPEGAAVYVDDKYVGSTPLDYFVSAGKHRFRLEKSFFRASGTSRQKDAKTAGGEEVNVPRRLLGSIFFPKKTSYHRELTLVRPYKYARENFRRISDWGLVGSFHNRYQYPASIAETTRNLMSAATKKNTEGADFPQSLPVEKLPKIYISAAVNNLGAAEMYRDFDRALEPIEGDISDKVIDFDLYKYYGLLAPRNNSENKRSAEITGAGTEVRNKLQRRIDSLQFESFYSSVPESIPDIEASFLERRISVGGHSFALIPGSRGAPLGRAELFDDGDEPSFEDLSAFPHKEVIPTFYMAISEVNSRQYAAFLEENPAWREEALDKLVKESLVTKDYLQGFDGDSSEPVRYVSWYAAKAYAEWMEKKISDELEFDYIVRLAREAEWEYAVRFNRADTFIDAQNGYAGPRQADFSRTGDLGVADLRGNLWEWTEGWYFPSDVLDGRYGLTQEYSSLFDGVEKSVRGGSWANEVDTLPVWKRASQPPQWCTAFTGFRIVIVPKNELPGGTK